jgi:hypothetical protein
MKKLIGLYESECTELLSLNGDGYDKPSYSGTDDEEGRRRLEKIISTHLPWIDNKVCNVICDPGMY